MSLVISAGSFAVSLLLTQIYSWKWSEKDDFQDIF